MQLPRRTRCLIDAGFGHRYEDTDTVDHLASVVDQSSASNVSVVWKMGVAVMETVSGRSVQESSCSQ